MCSEAFSGGAPVRRDVLYAMTTDGLQVPIIDVTNRAFALSVSDEEIAAMCAQFVAESGQASEVPAAVRVVLQRSVLGSGLMAAAGTFLDGMSTYLLKLGPANLWDEAQDVDRRLAASFPAFMTRLRLDDVSRLLADGLSHLCEAVPGRPLWLFNIGGGAAADSWNALIRMRMATPALTARTVRIVVLDVERDAPAFAARAVAALAAPGAPLAGLDVSVDHQPHDWSDVPRLRGILAERDADESVCGISSEGGLFEYGSDADIVGNLETLGAMTGGAIVVGSVTRDGEASRAAHRGSEVATKARTLDAFQDLVMRAGWTLERAIERPFSYHVRLAKM